MRRDVLGTQGEDPPHPPDRSTQPARFQRWGHPQGAKRQDRVTPAPPPCRQGSALSGWAPAKARAPIIYRLSHQRPRRPPRLRLGASCLLRAGETPALRRQGDAKRLRNRVITSYRHSLAALARPISRSSGVNDHAAQLRSRSVRLGSRTALPCRVSMFAASRVAVVALRWFGLPPSPAQGCARWAQRPCGARVGASAPRGSLRSPRRYQSDIFGLPSIFCACGAVALARKYRREPSSDIDSINPSALNNNK